jgi:hypothetical protein
MNRAILMMRNRLRQKNPRFIGGVKLREGIKVMKQGRSDTLNGICTNGFRSRRAFQGPKLPDVSAGDPAFVSTCAHGCCSSGGRR